MRARKYEISRLGGQAANWAEIDAAVLEQNLFAGKTWIYSSGLDWLDETYLPH